MNPVCLLLLLPLCWLEHEALVERSALLETTVMSAAPHLKAGSARLATFGFYELAADKVYIAFINYFGDKKNHRLHYPAVIPLLSQSLVLDPLFLTAYRYAGVLMSLEGADSKEATRLLERGEAMRPDAWEIPFLRAAAAMDIENDVSLAAMHMSRAARLTGAPAYLRPLAIRLTTSGGHPDVGLELVDVLLQQTQDEGARAVLLERRQQVLYEQSILQLNQAIEAFQKDQKRPPESIVELEKRQFYVGTRFDPWGAPLIIDESGHATSKNSSRRLRIYKAPTDSNMSSSSGASPP